MIWKVLHFIGFHKWGNYQPCHCGYPLTHQEKVCEICNLHKVRWN